MRHPAEWEALLQAGLALKSKETRWEAGMAETQLFRFGADVSCTDGDCGEVRCLVIDPSADVVTHLVVEPKHRQGLGQLVPLDLVETTNGQVRLRCSKAEFEQLEPADETQFLPGTRGYETYGPEQVISWPYHISRGGMPGVRGDTIPGVSQTVTSDNVPEGEAEVPRGEHVHATDGDIGQVQGVVVDPGNRRVTYVLLQEGHLWGRKEVLIPRDVVAGVDTDGFHLSITKQQVQNLPPVDTGHPAG